jgi:hypothetical protein
MISYDPSGYNQKTIQDDKFYQDILSSMGLAAGFATLRPFSRNYGVDVALGEIFNIDLTQNVKIVAAPTRTVLFHGSLMISYYSTVASPGQLGIALNSGPNNNLSTCFFVYEDVVTPNVIQRVYFDSVMFNYLYFQNDSATDAYHINIHFSGLQINY